MENKNLKLLKEIKKQVEEKNYLEKKDEEIGFIIETDLEQIDIIDIEDVDGREDIL